MLIAGWKISAVSRPAFLNPPVMRIPRGGGVVAVVIVVVVVVVVDVEVLVVVVVVVVVEVRVVGIGVAETIVVEDVTLVDGSVEVDV